MPHMLRTTMRRCRSHAFFIALLFMLLPVITNAQTNYWTGSVSADYFTKYNWSDTTINYALLTSTTLMIGAGNPNDCLHKGGNSGNVNYRSSRLNTLTGSNFTVNGALYTNNSDSLNGTVTINAPADFNVRNIVYIGRSATANVTITGGALASKNGMYIATGTGGNATVTVSGGSLNAGAGGANMDLNLANGAGLTGRLNISGGTVRIARNLNIGAGGSIFISGIGLLQVAGDKTGQLNALVADGRLTCTAGKTLSITYDGTNTIAIIPQNPNSMMREYSDNIVLNNGVIVATIEKRTSNIISLKVNGVETIATSGNKKYVYYDFTTSFGFETMYGMTMEVVQDTTDIVEISFKRPYTPSLGHVTPCDADIRYVLKKGDKGLYTYSVLEHPASYPAFDLGSWRQVLWIAPKDATNYLCEKIYVDSIKHWQMPSLYDWANASATGIAEIVKLNTGVRAGKYDGKYEYSTPLWEAPAYGHASDVNNIGTWMVFGSHEYFSEGPTYHDLNAAAGIIHVCMNGVHYNTGGINIPQGEYWRKIYGPYLMYFSDKATGDSNWIDAKARAAAEKAQWPYSWLHHPAYPLASERGAVSGKFIINDPFKPAVKGQNAWVGVTQIANDEGQWQFECKNYHYWVKTDSAGNFSIPDIRPGAYTFFAYSDGETGDYQLQNVVVTAGATTDLGNQTWDIPRNKGKLFWEIGVPNRKSDEFKMGDFDYCEGHVQQKFRDTFPNPIEYNVADKNWAQKLCYAHTPYPDTDSTRAAWKWRIHFTLPNTIPATGNATLTIAYASADHANQFIYVNGENKLFTNFYPDIAGGNGFLRQTNYTKYSIKTVSIPFSKLKAGENIITLVMASTQSFVNHFMYDYISFEADIPNPKPVLQITQHNVSCYGGNDGTITASFDNGTPPYQIMLDSTGTFATRPSPYIFNNLVAGNYAVYVKDSLNEADTAMVTITEPAALVLSLNKTDVTHHYGNDGTITATFSGGTPPFAVKLNRDSAYSIQTSPYTFAQLTAGNYVVYVTDSNSCNISDTIILCEPGNSWPGGNWLLKPHVVPNPSHHQFVLIMLGDFEYSLFSLSGQPLLQGRGSNLIRFGENLLPGMYMLRVKAKGKTYVEKVIKL